MVNPICYRIYYSVRLARKKRLKLPASNDDIYIDGYPRSGNTFFVNLVKHYYPDARISHHLHTAAALKIALSKQIPIAILLRSPADAIASNAHRKRYFSQDKVSDSLLLTMINDYVQYYTQVMERSNQLTIVAFEEMRLSPLNMLQTKIAPSLSAMPAYPFDETNLELFRKDLIAPQQDKAAGQPRSLPDQISKTEKDDYRERVQGLGKFDQAQQLFDEIQASTSSEKGN